MFLAVAIACVADAITRGGPHWLMLWPAVAFAVVGVAYATGDARPLGKRADGRVSPWATAVLLPYLVYARGVWHVRVALSREHPADEVAPGVWVGRRPRDGELPTGLAVVIDLAAEMPAAASVRRHPGYRSVATLDAMPTRPAELAAVVRHLETAGGPAYIGCAFGHGRSAAAAAPLLIRRGLAVDVAAAEQLIRQRRPAVRLTRRQRAAATAALDLLNR